jgi:aminopeptidase N
MKDSHNASSNASATNTFEFPGSSVHHTPFLNFNILRMLLKINPDFDSKTLVDCETKITIKVLVDLREIELDMAEMRIERCDVTPSTDIKIENLKILDDEDKLKIQFDRVLNAGTVFDLNIKYSAGYFSKNNTVPSLQSPRSGFHFITKTGGSSAPAIQSWTQGETLESRYWFPCIDDPQVKYPREIHIAVPSEDYTVISNGVSDVLQTETVGSGGDVKKVKWIWNEPNPNPAYLTSVVIGKFHKQYFNYDNGRVHLHYYWPLDMPENNAMLTFGETPSIMKFFEDYFGVKYPYEKYSQVTVEDFELGGMENTSCTTLTKNILHDEKVLPDYVNDVLVVVHELAHQWFGDLVTCKDWSNIWLNEGFASYSEALYWQESRKENKFLFMVHQDMARYLEEATKSYKRPIVTRVFKHPDELFDAHSYQKGSCVLHMLRHHIGDTSFKGSLKEYLLSHKHGSAETDDFRKICERVSGKDLQQFFDQWLFRKGHPVLEIEYSLNNDSANGKQINIKVKQVQEEDHPFVFSLDVRVVFFGESNHKEPQHYQISAKTFEQKIDIPPGETIKYISLDPNLNLIKEIKSVKIPEEKDDFQLKDLLLNQLKNGYTIIERIQAASLLKNCYSEETLDALKNMIMNGDFYGVLVEVADVLGSFNDAGDYTKTNNACNALTQCLQHPGVSSSQAIRSIIRNIGAFGRSESIPVLLKYLQDENHFIQSAAATAIGKSCKDMPASDMQKTGTIIKKLKEIVTGPTTFQNTVAQGAIDGLKEFCKHDDAKIMVDVANFLVEKTSNVNEYFIRVSATAALGKFLKTDDKKNMSNKDDHAAAKQMNQKVFDCLVNLLHDERQRVKINACTSLADADAKTSTLDSRLMLSVDSLVDVAEHDLDGFVRSQSERSANVIREWIKELASHPPKIDIKLREKREP